MKNQGNMTPSKDHNHLSLTKFKDVMICDLLDRKNSNSFSKEIQ